MFSCTIRNRTQHFLYIIKSFGYSCILPLIFFAGFKISFSQVSLHFSYFCFCFMKPHTASDCDVDRWIQLENDVFEVSDVYLLCKLVLIVTYYVSSYCRFILVSVIWFNFLHTVNLFPCKSSVWFDCTLSCWSLMFSCVWCGVFNSVFRCNGFLFMFFISCLFVNWFVVIQIDVQYDIFFVNHVLYTNLF